MGEYAEVIAKLRRVAAGDLSDVTSREHGLCSAVICRKGHGHSLLIRCQFIFETWKYFSGVRMYPVPSTTRNGRPDLQYLETANLYDKRTKYGKLRMDLAGYVADELERLYG